MNSMFRRLAVVIAAVAAAPLFAQQPSAPTLATPDVAAVIVNGKVIPERAVQRGLKRVLPAEHVKARPEIVNFLIDNLLIEQYLVGLKVTITPEELTKRFGEFQEECKKHKQEYSKLLQDLNLSEAELKAEIEADLRWEKFVEARATPEQLKGFFDQNTEMFDGSMVRARHILITPAANDPKGPDSAKALLLSIKQQVETAGAAAVSKLPATADPLAREQVRGKAMEDAFSRAAEQHSACPSKKEGGDISWFPRAGSMVESFAKVAFTLKQFQVSDVVVTPFGLHLIMVTGRKPGQPQKFETVKEEVREIFSAKLREAVLAQARPVAKIAITPKQ